MEAGKINRKAITLTLVLITIALASTSCRPSAPPPTARPSPTSTPRSTPLPPLPTSVPLGSTGNPLHLVIVAPSALEAARAATDTTVSDLEAALLEESTLTVAVDLVGTDAEALSALCASVAAETVSAAWLSGLGAMTAEARNCGSVALQVERGTRSNAATGEAAALVVASDSPITGAGDLTEKTFCRLGVTDTYSWLVPMLMLRAAGVSPDDLAAAVDYTDPNEMVRAVADGTCDAAGIALSEYNDLRVSARSSVKLLSQSTTIPYAVLVYPAELPLGEQQQLTDALIAIGNGTRADLLTPLVKQDQLLAATPADFSSLRSFLSRAKVDLAQLGQ